MGYEYKKNNYLSERDSVKGIAKVFLGSGSEELKEFKQKTDDFIKKSDRLLNKSAEFSGGAANIEIEKKLNVLMVNAVEGMKEASTELVMLAAPLASKTESNEDKKRISRILKTQLSLERKLLDEISPISSKSLNKIVSHGVQLH